MRNGRAANLFLNVTVNLNLNLVVTPRTGARHVVTQYPRPFST